MLWPDCQGRAAALPHPLNGAACPDYPHDKQGTIGDRRDAVAQFRLENRSKSVISQPMPPAKLRNCSLACLAFLAAVPALAELRKVVDLNTPREFPNVTNRVEWETRARQIREQILVSAGLWPVPEKTPLNPVIFGKVLHADYSIEKVYFQTTPGFYLAGNLYRPVGKGNGAFPAILNPHGHSPRGRLEDETNSSTVARCANFARQGMIAFAYDMVGYNDTHFPETPPGSSFSSAHWNFATNNPACQLWNVSLMG